MQFAPLAPGDMGSDKPYPLVTLEVASMFHFRTFIADDHAELDRQLIEYFRDRKCINMQFLELIGDGSEANYAVLVAWEE